MFITHRLNTIKDSDKIVLMHNGKVVEEGTHAELIEEGLRYKTLSNHRDSMIRNSRQNSFPRTFIEFSSLSAE